MRELKSILKLHTAKHNTVFEKICQGESGRRDGSLVPDTNINRNLGRWTRPSVPFLCPFYLLFSHLSHINSIFALYPKGTIVYWIMNANVIKEKDGD